MKKLVALSLALILTLGIGVPALGEGSSRICDETITVTVSGRSANAGVAAWNDTIQVAELESRLGIRLDCHEYSSDAWESQLTLMMAGDDMPDMLINTGISLADVADYGSQGYFLALNDYIPEYAPDMAAFMKEYPMVEKYMTSPDGNMYAVVGYWGMEVFQINYNWLRSDYLRALGSEVPRTLDEFTQLMYDIRDKDVNNNGDAGDEWGISFSGDNAGGVENMLLNAFGIYTSANDMLWTLDENGSLTMGETTENYKMYLKYMNKLFEDGCIDPESFIQTRDEWKAKAANEQVALFTDGAIGSVHSKGDQYTSENFTWIGALTSEYSAQPTITRKNNAVTNTAKVLISADTRYPKELVQLVNYFYTEEGYWAGRFGYEGMTFEFVECGIKGSEDYKIQKSYNADFHPEKVEPFGFSNYSSPEDFRQKKVTVNAAFTINVLSPNSIYGLAEHCESIEQLDAIIEDATYGWASIITKGLRSNEFSYVDGVPTRIYTEDEVEKRAVIYNDILLYLQTMKTQFINGTADIDVHWDEFQAQLKTLRVDELTEIEQAAYDRLMK